MELTNYLIIKNLLQFYTSKTRQNLQRNESLPMTYNLKNEIGTVFASRLSRSQLSPSALSGEINFVLTRRMR